MLGKELNPTMTEPFHSSMQHRALRLCFEVNESTAFLMSSSIGILAGDYYGPM